MKDEIDVVIGSIEFPSIEIDVVKPQEQKEDGQLLYTDVVETESNQMLVEGVTELKNHPQLEPLLKALNDVKNDFVLKVLEVSENFELKGSVKVLFAIGRKDK